MRRISIDKTEPGVVLGKTIYTDSFDVLLNKGVVLTTDYIIRLKARGYTTIYVDDAETADVVIKDPISDKIRTMATKDIHKVYKITQASMVKIEADTADAVIKSINTPKFKKAFQHNPILTHLCNNLNHFLEGIMSQDVLSGLNSIKSFDNYTYEHSVDTAVISTIIAKKLMLSQDKLKQVAVGEFLHDIGKIFIDEKIINKPGKLTPEEFETVKLHPVYGYELLKDVERIGSVAAHIPYQHHERQDGRGYPRGLKGTNKLDMGSLKFQEGDRLIMLAEIAAIADFYDACISDRPYRKGLSPDLVYELIKTGSGVQFNKELVDCFLSVVPKYPVGYEMRVKSGEYKDYTGIVASVNPQRLSSPKILLLNDDQKKKIKPIEIDLGSYTRHIEIECFS
ncbi:MAG: HD-GYP domain-containing protein [Planctomycetota bacterium]